MQDLTDYVETYFNEAIYLNIDKNNSWAFFGNNQPGKYVVLPFEQLNETLGGLVESLASQQESGLPTSTIR